MKTKHRIRRDRKQPQPGTPGAPFRGVYTVRISVLDGPGGFGYVQAAMLDETGTLVPNQIWPEERAIDPSAIKVYSGGAAVELLTAEVYGGGSEIYFTFAASGADASCEVIAMHPSLIGMNGTACGGTVYTQPAP